MTAPVPVIASPVALLPLPTPPAISEDGGLFVQAPLQTHPLCLLAVVLPAGKSRMILPRRMSTAGKRRHAGAEQVDGF